MIPYIILIVLPLLCSFVSIYKGEQYEIRIGKQLREDSIALPVFFTVLTLMLMLRHESIGRDLMNYKYMFQNYPLEGLDYVFSSWQEVLFKLYLWLNYQLTGNYQIFLAVTALICVLPIAYIYCQDKSHAFLKVIVFVNMSTFIMLFSGLRQAMAMGIGMLAYQAVKEKKLAKHLAWSAVAFLIHHSGFMVFLFYPLYHIRIKKVVMLTVIPALCAIFVLKRQIFTVAVSILGSAIDKYEATAISTGAYEMLILFILFTVFVYVIADETKCDEELLGLRNYMLFTIVLQCFAPVHSLSMRMNYYFILFIPMGLGKSLNYPKEGMKQVARLGELVMIVFFSIWFVLTTYESYVTGISMLDTIPYVPFWAGV